MFQALRNRNVALLCSAQLVSVGGDLVLFVALPFWMYELTGSALATGLMFVALTIPQLVVSPLAGVLVDRLDRKRVMVAADVVRAALVASYLVVNTPEQAWLIYVIAFAESTVSQFFRPAMGAVLPTLVHGETERGQANAASGAAFSIAQLGGPALGGVLVATVGPHAAALVDAASYLLSALLVLAIHMPVRAQAAAQLEQAGQVVQALGRELGEGVRIALGRPALRVVLTSFGLLYLSQGIINVLYVVLIDQVWHSNAQGFGWWISAQGVGGIAGSFVAGALVERVSPRAMIVGGGVTTGVMLWGMVNQPSLLVAIGLIFILGIAVVTLDVGLTTLLQTGSDDANRGRVTSLTQTTMATAQLISLTLTSLLASTFGAVALLNVAGMLTFCGGLVGLLAHQNTLRTRQELED